MAELALDSLDDSFYCILATERMINSELQPLPCCRTERELISPSSLFFSSFLACSLEAYGKVFALFGVTLHLLLAKEERQGQPCLLLFQPLFCCALCCCWYVNPLQCSWLSSVETVTVVTRKVIPR